VSDVAGIGSAALHREIFRHHNYPWFRIRRGTRKAEEVFHPFYASISKATNDIIFEERIFSPVESAVAAEKFSNEISG